MATYEYRCGACGPFVLQRSIGTAPEVAACPACSASARRVFSPPLLTRTLPGLARMLGREEQSREAPDVVSRRAGRPRIADEPHPALKHLPKP